jgi:hypothetical protein
MDRGFGRATTATILVKGPGYQVERGGYRCNIFLHPTKMTRTILFQCVTRHFAGSSRFIGCMRLTDV